MTKSTHIAQEVPMMFRAQTSGRCSLQFAGSQDDRDRWTKELLNCQQGESQPSHQHSEDIPNVIEDGYFFRTKIEFSWRVFTNSGQDSIARPVLDVRGIPHIPGSSIKGLFRRGCQERDRKKNESEKLTNLYCGDTENLEPGILRFHGAYPVGDWAGTIEDENPDNATYRMVDVVHPQQDWQIGKPSQKKNASALISLYKPTLVFEISSSKALSQEKWETIQAILKSALRPGLGGKTSSGYGLVYQPKDKYEISAYLRGQGINPVLLGKNPEFRPNTFKATLRSHTRRLLAGCISNERDVDRLVGELFGSTKAPARVEIYWDGKFPVIPESTYKVKGTLGISVPTVKEQEMLKSVFQFAYTMGGFGKSWRRVWHKIFYPKRQYDKDIGCHWRADEDWLEEIQKPKQLTAFLDRLEQVCQDYCGSNNSRPLDWREAWHRDRVAVYAAVTERSQAIQLFHDPKLKMTPEIGGKNKGDDRPKYVSSVWHRMLPIPEKRYLEIVTVFHQRKSNKGNRDNPLKAFTDELRGKNLKLVWGTHPQTANLK